VSPIVWLPEAVKDVQRLFDFLKDKNPEAAARAAKTVQKGANTLGEFPEIGYPMNDGTERRELLLPFGAGAYILRYIIDGQTIVIIRVWHSREHRE
jgi:plasmid stabilization system protein ParE